jgi:hypothetical protein
LIEFAPPRQLNRYALIDLLMDILTFIAEIIKAVAWPLAVVLIILLLRKPIASLIPLLQRLKYKDLELEFGRRVEEIKAEAASELPLPSVAAPPPGVSEDIARLSEISPRAAVLEAWRRVEDLIVKLAREHLPEEQVNKFLPHQALRFLERKQIIDPALGSVLTDLKSLRNEAAHAPQFALSAASAMGYASATALVEQTLRGFADRA